MKKIPEQKLQAFSMGAMGNRQLSRREVEEQRKKQEEEAAAHVFQEFVETFQETPSSKTSKVWVKAGTYDAGARKEDTSERGKLYKPQSRLSEASAGRSSVEKAQELARVLGSRPPPPPLRRRGDSNKKKSNLELFKEELQKIQEEREERHKYKGILKTTLAPGADAAAAAAAAEANTMYSLEGSYDNGDPNTTNLYLGNLNPKITEQELMEIFGRYGPLASIKIMWPRSDEEKARGRNCGFVAFMSRKDGERALRNINGKEVLSYEMKLGWGKAVVIPPVPIYIPPVLQQTKPIPPSGLPFNAQPPKHLIKQIPRVRAGDSYPNDPHDKEIFKQILAQSIVKIVIPTERNILMLIHRMVEFVIREGPMFEAMIMNKEINNPFFRFLFDNQSAAHIYYRWKLFSLLQGDSPKTWSLKDFRMFKGGSVWRPPVMNIYTAGMPEDLIEEDEPKDIRGTLSNNQRERLEDLIRTLTPERQGIAEAMVWCMEHAEAYNEICDCITESLSNVDTAIHKKIARLYLVSDILHNCGSKLNASGFRKALQARLPQIMRECGDTLKRQESRLQSEGFRARVTRVFQAWADWALFPSDYLIQLNQSFNGIQEKEEEPGSPGAGSTASEAESWSEETGGGPLDGAALRRLAAAHNTPTQPAVHTPRAQQSVLDDIDGVPMDEDIDGVPMEGSGYDDSEAPAPGFVPSKWESVEPAEVEAGAVTTSQWERLVGTESPARSPSPRSPSPLPTTPIDTAHDSNEAWSSRRAVLREVEVKVLKYQDELESGRRSLKAGLTQAQQLQHYRKKLIKKATREAKEKEEAALESPEVRHKSDESKKHREREERRERAASHSSEEGYSTSVTSSSRKSKKSKNEVREISISPPPHKRSRHRSRSRERVSHRRRTPTPPPAPRRRTPSPPPISTRKHKHSKHKY